MALRCFFANSPRLVRWMEPISAQKRKQPLESHHQIAVSFLILTVRIYIYIFKKLKFNGGFPTPLVSFWREDVEVKHWKKLPLELALRIWQGETVWEWRLRSSSLSHPQSGSARGRKDHTETWVYQILSKTAFRFLELFIKSHVQIQGVHNEL